MIMAKPIYNSETFDEFCESEKARGLHPALYSQLPEMWKEELAFRKEFEESLGLGNFADGKNRFSQD